MDMTPIERATTAIEKMRREIEDEILIGEASPAEWYPRRYARAALTAATSDLDGLALLLANHSFEWEYCRCACGIIFDGCGDHGDFGDFLDHQAEVMREWMLQ